MTFAMSGVSSVDGVCCLWCLQAREAISGLEGFGAAASESSKLGLLKSGLVYLYDLLDGPGWREQKPGWSRADRQGNVSGW